MNTKWNYEIGTSIQGTHDLLIGANLQIIYTDKQFGYIYKGHQANKHVQQNN